ncbi:MAG: EAL domain-containing protein [Thiobacillus sp.]|nr:EAL domain-containing protein [Thiobacillus sp.]
MRARAEGIESAAVLNALRELGCGIAQGYHVGRPTPMDHLEKWLRQ